MNWAACNEFSTIYIRRYMSENKIDGASARIPLAGLAMRGSARYSLGRFESFWASAHVARFVPQ
jgi:hypothetical protein